MGSGGSGDNGNKHLTEVIHSLLRFHLYANTGLAGFLFL